MAADTLSHPDLTLAAARLADVEESLARMTVLYPGRVVAADDAARKLRKRVRNDSETRRLLALLAKAKAPVTRQGATRPKARERRPRSRSRTSGTRGDPDSDLERPRRQCAVCDGSLAGRRKHAVTCSVRCRVALHRSRSPLPAADVAALERRYEAALPLLGELTPGERVELLAAVVWPEARELAALEAA
jgi:hypothetical protein